MAATRLRHQESFELGTVLEFGALLAVIMGARKSSDDATRCTGRVRLSAVIRILTSTPSH